MVHNPENKCNFIDSSYFQQFVIKRIKSFIGKYQKNSKFSTLHEKVFWLELLNENGSSICKCLKLQSTLNWSPICFLYIAVTNSVTFINVYRHGGMVHASHTVQWYVWSIAFVAKQCRRSYHLKSASGWSFANIVESVMSIFNLVLNCVAPSRVKMLVSLPKNG